MEGGFTAAELRGTGLSAGELRTAGYSGRALRTAGFTAQELKEVCATSDVPVFSMLHTLICNPACEYMCAHAMRRLRCMHTCARRWASMRGSCTPTARASLQRSSKGVGSPRSSSRRLGSASSC